MSSWQDTFEPLKEFSRIIKYRDFEFERWQLCAKPFDKKSYSFVMNTQKQLNNYINDFQNKFSVKKRTAIEEQELGDLQGKYLTEIIAEIPTEDEDIKELFSNKILESFALHNRSLAENWNPSNEIS